MIKKLKLFIFAFLFVLFWFGFSFWFDLYEDMFVRQNWVIWVSPYSSAYDVAWLSKWWLFSQSLWVWKNLFYLKDWVYFAWIYHPSYWSVVPYISAHSWSAYVQWVPLKYAICDSFSWQHISDYTLQNCTINNFSVWSLNWITNFLWSITSDDYFAFKFIFVDYVSSVDSVWLLYCMSSNSLWKSLCFWIADDDHSNYIYPWYTTKWNYTWDLDYPTEWDSITREILSNSPAYVWSNTWWIDSSTPDYVVNNTENDVVWYYESFYWWDDSICYTNTTDLDSVYWTIWETWTGRTSIFDMFSHYYNRLPSEDWYTIIGRWLDFYLINYDLWFWTDWNPRYLLVWNPLQSPRNIIYSWFTPPFTDVPSAIFFLVDHQASYLPFASNNVYWREVAMYCDMKLNWTNSYPLVTWNVSERINIWWSQKWKGLLVDWSWNVINYQNPSNSDWSNWTWFWSTVYWKWTWNTDFQVWFSDFYSKMSSLFDRIDYNVVGIIPDYILFFLVFIILIRLFKK